MTRIRLRLHLRILELYVYTANFTLEEGKII
jgi:hypothetical protein